MRTTVIWRFNWAWGPNNSLSAKWCRNWVFTFGVLVVAWTFHRMAPGFQMESLGMNVPRNQSHGVLHDSAWKLCRVSSTALHWLQMVHPGSRWKGTMQRLSWDESLGTVFGDLISQTPKSFRFQKYTYFLISSPLGSEKTKRKALLGQYESQWSHSRVIWAAPDFSQASRLQGISKEGRMIKKGVGATSE